MNLSFATKFPTRKKGLAGKPTYFVEKIWKGLKVGYNKESKFFYAPGDKLCLMDKNYPGWCGTADKIPKIHTIRKDETERWKKGSLIHFTIFPRTQKQFVFAPVIECTGTERIKIHHWQSSPNPIVIVGDTVLNLKAIEQLAFNDGFDSIDDFFKWFDKDFQGWIIHWTAHRYEVNEIDVIDMQTYDPEKSHNITIDQTESGKIKMSCEESLTAKDDAVDPLSYAIQSKHGEPLHYLEKTQKKSNNNEKERL